MKHKQVRVANRERWREWLAKNHDKELEGVWLVYQKKGGGEISLNYEESVEEALCFGWIDSVIRRIDDEFCCRKFSPRKDHSLWSDSNRKRLEKVMKEGRMTPAGLAKIEAAKKSGSWNKNPQPVIPTEVPEVLASALARNARASRFFEGLTPGYRKQFIAWIVMAKRPETQARRLAETIRLLEKGEKLGLK